MGPESKKLFPVRKTTKDLKPYTHKKDTMLTMESQLNLRKLCQQNSTLKNLFTAKSAKDPAVLDYIKCFHLSPPLLEHFHSESLIRKATEESLRRRKLKDLLKHQETGFFVDCSPCIKSHSAPFSFSLEVRQDWEGLLFERNPIKMLQLNALFPKSWMSNACLSTSAKKPFLKIKENSRCFSIISFLKALNKSRIDLLSLGEGEQAPGSIIKPLLSRPEYRIEIIDLAHEAVKSVRKTQLRDFIKSKGYNLTLETPKHYIFERVDPAVSEPTNRNTH
ncbi:unnamed protein product [Allacma fusca]|uniref:Uncharacterized protein n=1 Tax=Allacma fusca TaxID=39272 RepID=A0A8J2KE27_9HEXA|nr:unnamed protein product [Allacma fusca]